MLMDEARKQRGPSDAPQGQPQGQPQGEAAAKPDWRQFTPPELQDTVERIIAAGVKVMYSPKMREELKQAVAADMPADQKLAENAVGLLLTLDQQAEGGIPVAALFPAAMGLLGEAAAVLEAAGQPVDQEAWNDAAMRMYVLIGKKLGGSDEQIMQGAQQAMGGQQPEAEDATEPGEPPEGSPADGPEDAAEGESPDSEEEAMRKGMMQ